MRELSAAVCALACLTLAWGTPQLAEAHGPGHGASKGKGKGSKGRRGPPWAHPGQGNGPWNPGHPGFGNGNPPWSGGHPGNGPWGPPQPSCYDIDGDFSSAPVFGPACDSPVGFCTLGQLTGDLDGSYAFTMTSSTPAPTPELPTRETFTGVSTIVTDCGTLFGDDTGEIWFDGEAGFVTRVTVWSGDGCWEDVTGSLVASGALDLATGGTLGTYTGELCEEAGGC